MCMTLTAIYEHGAFYPEEQVDIPEHQKVTIIVPDQMKLETPSNEVWERALSAMGRFHSGLGDLSTNHDSYFAESVES